jgi:PAS domain-containing protein
VVDSNVPKHGFARDTTETKHSSHKPIEANQLLIQQYQLIVNAVTDGIVRVNREATITFVKSSK